MTVKRRMGRVQTAVFMRNLRLERELEIRRAVEEKTAADMTDYINSRLEQAKPAIRQRYEEQYERNLFNRIVKFLKRKMGH